MKYRNRIGLKYGVILAAASVLLSCFARDHEEALEWFQDSRFGVFLHWTSQSIAGDWVDNSGLDYGEQRPSRNEQIKRYKEFDPTCFDADEWLDIVARSGAKYISFTTKHVLGFCMWDNPYSEFDIMSTDFKRDICKDLAEGARARDLGLFWYYGSSDRQHPDYESAAKDPDSPFYDYQSKTVEYLLTKYGRIDGMWWDGAQKYHNEELMQLAKKHQSHLLMTGRYHRPSGDFGTPEQEVGSFSIDAPWESCIPIQGITWMWNGGRDIKDVPTCLRALAQCAVGGGNLLLNISPKPDGTLQQEQVDVLLAMGRWLKQYGESIYGTRGGPYKPGSWGGSTRKGNKVYLHIMQHLEDGKLELPALPLTLKTAHVLTEGTANVVANGATLVVTLDEAARRPDPITVIELELDGDVMALKPVDIGGERETLTADIATKASSQRFDNTPPAAALYHTMVEENADQYAKLERFKNRNKEQKIPEELAALPPCSFSARKRGFRYRYWMAAEDDPQPWLEVDLGESKRISEVHLMEKFCRIRGFELQYEKEGAWISFYEGGRMNFCDVKLAEPILAQKVRLVIKERTDEGPPGIKIFDLF